MIHIDMKPEPASFEELVRKPGNAFLALHPKPTQKQWNTHSFWRNVLTEFRRLYGGICAYSCHWIAPDTGAKTVEHFIPKHEDPTKAYEWDNYRLVCSLLNSRKQTNTDTLDPFEVQDGWFVIDFPSLLVKPAAGIDPAIGVKVRQTITRLKLNDEATCLENRAKYVMDYCLGAISFGHIKEEAPFLAKELQRQNLVNQIQDIMGYQ